MSISSFKKIFLRRINKMAMKQKQIPYPIFALGAHSPERISEWSKSIPFKKTQRRIDGWVLSLRKKGIRKTHIDMSISRGDWDSLSPSSQNFVIKWLLRKTNIPRIFVNRPDVF